MGELELLTVKDTARCLGITERAVRTRIASNKLQAIQVKSSKGGRGGTEFRIPFTALPPAAQKKYRASLQSEAETNMIQETVKEKPFESYTQAEREQIAFWRSCLNDWQMHRSQPGKKAELDEQFCTMWNEQHPSFQVTTKKLYRLHKKWKKEGDIALVDKRGGWNRGESAIPEKAWAVFQQYWLDEARPAATACYRWTETWAEQEGLAPLPSYETFHRHLKSIPYPVVQYFRYGEKAYDDKAAPYIRRMYDDIASNEIWVADNHTFDVMVRRENGSQYRPYLTMYTDVRSRLNVAFVVSENPNADTNLLALRKGIKRYGIPSIVYTDNGRDFLVTDIAGRGRRKTKKVKEGDHKPPAIFERLDIKMMNAKVRNGKAKLVERTFREVKENFSKLFLSYMGGHVKERPERLKKVLKSENGVIEEADFIELVETFIEGWLNCQPHHGDGMNGRTPQEVYAANLHEKRMATEEDLNLMMLRTSGMLTVGRLGVRLTMYGYKLDYYNADLVAQYNRKKVYVRYDPEDMGSVRVYDENDKFLMVAENRKALSYQASKEDLRRVASEDKKVKRQTKAYKEALEAQIHAPDPLDMVMQKAKQNLGQKYEPQAPVVTPVRSGERSEEQPLRKVAGQTDTVISLARMIENTRKSLEGK